MTERSAQTAEGLTGDRRLLLDHLLANPHHMAPMFRLMMRDRNGMSFDRALDMLRQEIAAADAKHAAGVS